jgi:hypothetical protein
MRLNDMYKYYSILISNNEYIQNNDIIIKMDNYEHQTDHFSIGVDL